MDNKRQCSARVHVAQSNDIQSVSRLVYTNYQNTFQHSKCFQSQRNGHTGDVYIARGRGRNLVKTTPDNNQ
jgi:hypothetical protein